VRERLIFPKEHGQCRGGQDLAIDGLAAKISFTDLYYIQS